MRIFLLLACLSIPLYTQAQQTNAQWLDKARTAYVQNNRQEALGHLQQLRKSSVKDSLYRIGLQMYAELQMDEFNLKEVVTSLEELIKLQPSSELSCQRNIARCKRYLGDYEGSVKAYQRVIQLDPKDKIVYNNMAAAYNDAGQYSNTLALLRNRKGALDLESFHLAVAYYHLNKSDSARLYIDQFLNSPMANINPSAYFYAARIYQQDTASDKTCTFIHKAESLYTNTKEEQSNYDQRPGFKSSALYKKQTKEQDALKKFKKKYCTSTQ